MIPYSDQGIHNILVKRAAFPVTISTNRDALTLTAGVDYGSNDYSIEGERCVFPDDVEIGITHQFYRHVELEAAVVKSSSTAAGYLVRQEANPDCRAIFHR